MFKVFVSLCYLWVFLATSTTIVSAQSQPKSVTKFQLERCMKRPTKYGGTARNIYVAWASGLAHTCLYSEFPADAARRYAIAQCEKSMRILRRKFGISAPCEIVVDRGQIVKRAYANAVAGVTKIPVKVRLFDKNTGELRTMRGLYRDYPTKFRGPNPTEFNFELNGDNIRLCNGKVRSSGGNSLKFQVICFGQKFSGRSQGEKIIKNGGILYLTPKKIRVERDGSWIELST